MGGLVLWSSEVTLGHENGVYSGSNVAPGPRWPLGSSPCPGGVLGPPELTPSVESGCEH